MKTPRIQDFDPNAKIPDLGSPMDNFPVIKKAQKPEIKEEPNHTVRPVLPVHPVLPVPPKRRVMKPRHPFDIYQDQYEALKQLADEDRRQGGVGSMSAMVRDALDNLIAKKTLPKKATL